MIVDFLHLVQLVALILSAPLLLLIAAMMLLRRPFLTEGDPDEPSALWRSLTAYVAIGAVWSLRDWVLVQQESYMFSTLGSLLRIAVFAVIAWMAWAAWKESRT